MTRWLSLVLASVLLVATHAIAEEPSTEETVPKTVHGGKQKIKSGGKEVGEGFRGIGRGIKKTFTGESSKEDYSEGGKQLGEGFKDLGTGTAGVGRGVGTSVGHAFTGEPDSTGGKRATKSKAENKD
ncbi:MAG: hypothetical protein HYR72_07400 [Deltaproteobacteria bacterium]|nr:hypothetical protein [Deltaproteobacteria bacterium]MBI3386914.1 hypothetical protein [Deltaproteobacteria bacterium]